MADASRPPSGSTGTGARSRAGRCLRLVLSGLLLTGAVLLASANGWFRSLEAVAAGPLVRLSTGSAVAVRPAYDTIFFDLYTERAIGLTVTPECTSALPVAALLGVAGMIALSRRFVLTRILTGLLIAATGVLLVNLARFTMIAWSTHEWGSVGFDWAHSAFGSIVTITGVSASVAVFFALATRGRSRAGQRPAEVPSAPSAAKEVPPS